MKTKKIEEWAKKKNPGRNVEKALKSLSEKRRPGSAKEAVAKKDLNITERKEAGIWLEKNRKELEVIKQPRMKPANSPRASSTPCVNP